MTDTKPTAKSICAEIYAEMSVTPASLSSEDLASSKTQFVDLAVARGIKAGTAKARWADLVKNS